jgi:hypothetical protein
VPNPVRRVKRGSPAPARIAAAPGSLSPVGGNTSARSQQTGEPHVQQLFSPQPNRDHPSPPGRPPYEDLAASSPAGLLRRTLGKGTYSRRTLGYRFPSRRTFGVSHPSRRTFGVSHPSRRTLGINHP